MKAEIRGAATEAAPRTQATAARIKAEPEQTMQRPNATRATVQRVEMAIRTRWRKSLPQPTTSRLQTSDLYGTYRAECIALALIRRKTRKQPKSRYNFCMFMAVFFIRLLTVLFFVGLVGSAVVVMISSIEDAKELFGKD
jgi:hypothetical protein